MKSRRCAVSKGRSLAFESVDAPACIMAAQVGPHPPKGRVQSMQVEAIDDEALMSYARLPSWITPSSTSMVGSMVLLVGYLLALTVLEVMAIADGLRDAAITGPLLVVAFLAFVGTTVI